MARLTNEQNDEIKAFTKMAKALVEDNKDEIVSTGFLNKNDLDDACDYVGEEDAYSEAISQKLLENTHSCPLSAYEVDLKLNMQADDMDSVAKYHNMEKTYIHIDIADGEHINCRLVISNNNEYYIFMTDKNNQVIKCEDGNYYDDIEITYLANHICGRGEIFKNQHVEERTIDELMHYFKTVEDEHFHSDEDLAQFKSDLINGALNEANDNEYKIDNIMENLIDGEGALSYLIIESENSANSIIAERNGDIIFIDMDSYRTERVDNGDEFTFKGIQMIAEPKALHNLQWELEPDGYSITAVHREPDIEEKPEVKKTRTLKPGM